MRLGAFLKDERSGGSFDNMETSKTYRNVAEGISLLEFNMEKLFDEMESGLKERYRRRWWIKAFYAWKLRRMRKAYDTSRRLISFGCKFLDLQYIDYIVRIKGDKIFMIDELTGEWMVSAGGMTLPKEDMSPRQLEEFRKVVRRALAHRRFLSFLRKLAPFAVHRKDSPNVAGSTCRHSQTRGSYKEKPHAPQQKCSDGTRDTQGN